MDDEYSRRMRTARPTIAAADLCATGNHNNGDDVSGAERERLSYFRRIAEEALPETLKTAGATANSPKFIHSEPRDIDVMAFEVKCIGDGHPVMFRDQSYTLVMTAPHTGVAELLPDETLDPHPNICKYFCHFTDSIPQEFYDRILPTSLKDKLVPDPQRNIFDWIIHEHHAETLGKLVKTSTLANSTTTTSIPWCIVHKYSRDICAALVHLFVVHQVVHFGLNLDTIAVTSNKEEAVLTELMGCSLRFSGPDKSFSRREVSRVVAGNETHTSPEILNGMYSPELRGSDQTTCDIMLNCEREMSFELGCVLFELAMRGKHPFLGYPNGFRGPDGLIPPSFYSDKEPAFTVSMMEPPAFPLQFRNLVYERNNEQHSEQINQVKKNLQQLQEKQQKTQEEDDDERKSVLTSLPELREAFESAKLLQSQLVTFASEFVLLDESVKKLNDSLQRATESNEELASHLKKLTERKGSLVMKLNESDSACKKLLGQTLTVQNSEPEIQECARNISTLTKKVWGIKSSTLTSTSEMEMVPKEEEEGDDNTVDGILMKPLLTVNDPQPHTFTPPFQLLCTLSDTLAQLQRCHFDECTKLADKHTVLSKELVEQVSVGGTLQKAIEETQRECSKLQREHKGKWRLQRGLEGDEKFIGMPCVWSQLSELLPQAQQAIVELSLSKATLSSSACFGGSQQQQPRLPSMTTESTAGGTTLPGCTATTSSVSPVLLSSVPNCNNSESNVCVECEERLPDVQLRPCGHVVLCSQCAAVMKKCPHCRTFIKDKIH
ncbi:hypothetical protein Pelo_4390 [Pelomyxa schiedti]|nr:hypothetical protein Pelo_4390 [Pelomyxa schiedti]